MGEIRGDIDEEAKRVLEPASSEGVPLRVLGGMAVRLRAPGELPASFNALYGTERPLFDPTMARLRDVAPAAAR